MRSSAPRFERSHTCHAALSSLPPHAAASSAARAPAAANRAVMLLPPASGVYPRARTMDKAHSLCVAPMMDWTDRHCRYFLRQVSSRAFLYTEMITTAALIHGDVDRHLAFSPEEHPVAVQLGGSEPDDLARCAKMAEDYGYDERS